MNLATAENLISRLDGIFPSFTTEWKKDFDEESNSKRNLGLLPGTPSVHSVYVLLFDFLQTELLSEKQLLVFAKLVNDAVAEGGVAENAVSTCFLEHLGSLELRSALWPLLLLATKASSRP